MVFIMLAISFFASAALVVLPLRSVAMKEGSSNAQMPLTSPAATILSKLVYTAWISLRKVGFSLCANAREAISNRNRTLSFLIIGFSTPHWGVPAASHKTKRKLGKDLLFRLSSTKLPWLSTPAG